MSEKRFKQCLLEEATHFEINGIRHDLLDNAQYSYNGTCAGIRWREEDVFVPEELFSTFGIKPLREIKRKPIEFEHIFTFEETSLGIIPYEAEGKRFRCVEILEEKK